jgi:soluble lytic murein transglycosylase-like protein
MKKICLSFVLSIVSVFSISAQTENKPTADLTASESVKVETDSPKIETETVKTTDKTSETNIQDVKTPQAAEKQKPEAVETVKKPEVGKAEKTLETAVNKPELSTAAKQRVVEPANNPGIPIKKVSLEGLSTGNSTVDGYIEEFSSLYNVDPLLIYAQMSQESSFNGRATSGKGASGFMQLMPDTARRFGVTNIYNPKQNIKAGVKYMRWLLDKFSGDTRLALAGYNAGEGAVMKYGNKIPPYRETQNYVTKIMKHYDLISNENSTFAQNDQPANQ